jgi:hypothetical protein
VIPNLGPVSQLSGLWRRLPLLNGFWSKDARAKALVSGTLPMNADASPTAKIIAVVLKFLSWKKAGRTS